jgi:hypothetical protein
LLEDLYGRSAIAKRAAMKPTLTTVSLIILGLSCGVPANAQDSKTEPAPSITDNVVSLTMVYAPAWSGLARSGISIPLTPVSMYWTADLAKFHSARQKLINLVLPERSLCVAPIGLLYRRISGCSDARQRRARSSPTQIQDARGRRDEDVERRRSVVAPHNIRRRPLLRCAK